MCKILVIPGLDPGRKEVNVNFMAQMADIMSKGNDDGLGYAAISKEGNLFGERWLFNQEAFDNRKHTHTKGRKIDKSKVNHSKMALGGFVEMEDEPDYPSFQKFGQFGKVSDEVSAIILHARRATNTICFDNTHPFVDMERQVAIIHNGVISNHVTEDEIRSTCDSERILNMYLKHGIDKNPMNMQAIIDDLKGWFAVGGISKDKDNRWVVDIFKNSQPNLGCAFVKELDAMVFSTELNDIRTACRLLDYTIVSKSKSGVKDDMLCRFDAVTGKPLMTLKYKDTRWEYTKHHYFKHEANSTDDSYKAQIAQWQKDKEEMEHIEREEEDKRRNARRTNNNVIEADFNKTEPRPNEESKQEEEELKRAGATVGELKEKAIKEYVDHYMSNGWERATAVEVATKQVEEIFLRKRIRKQAEDIGAKQKWSDKGIDIYERSLLNKNKLPLLNLEETKKIIGLHESNNLNEDEANKDGWTYSKESEVWVKRKTYKH